MRRLQLLAMAVFTACATAPVAPEPEAVPPPPTGPVTAIRNVRIFDGYGVIPSGNVIFQGEQLIAVGAGATIPEGATIVDGTGKTALPGLVDTRLHAADRAPLQPGVTSVFDLHSAPEGVASVGDGGFAEADYRASKESGVTMLGDSAECVAALATCVDAAHRAGKLALLQLASADQCAAALQANVDGIATVPTVGKLAPELVHMLKAHDVFVIAALASDGGAPIAPDAPTAPNDAHANVKALRDAGVPLIAGDDAPGSDSLQDELAELVRAGLTPVEALRSATSQPAQRLNLTSVGALVPGKRADVLLVDGDPTVDLSALQRIVAIYKRGRAVARAPVAAPVAPEPPQPH